MIGFIQLKRFVNMDKPMFLSFLMFAGISIWFLPFLIFMGNSIHNTNMSYKDRIKDLDHSIKCLNCCVKGFAINSTGCEDCPDFRCNVSSSVLLQHFKAKEIKKILMKELAKEVRVDVEHNSEMIEMSEAIVSPKLSFAHFYANGQPKKTDNGDYVMNNWEWRRGARHAYVTPSEMYHNRSSKVMVAQNGLYMVYIHTTFLNNGDDLEFCGFSHELRSNPGALLNATEVRSCRTGLLTNQHRGFHTLHSSGTYQLKKNDFLSVFYQMPDQFRISDIYTQTYFGMTLI